eukprot:TRINITY_DN9821_c0_g3_i1.p1 TRINITY_DN9821_c0_g3~~TRINITY_DN9821_c0_g3_i1.p1  ORF type:complete len:194 (+),score=19.65 TRINITY_DN9821_c0_g3_i1:215-796(+)
MADAEALGVGREGEAEVVNSLPGWDGIGYKVVARVGPRYFSVWAGDSSEYSLGAPARNEARPSHEGGLYVCLTPTAAAQHRIPCRRGGLFVAPRALLRCICEGPFVHYPGGKIACSGLTPLEEMTLPAGYLNIRPSSAARPPSRPLPPRPLSLSALRRMAGQRPTTLVSGLREETEALEAEVADLERRLGYRR